MIRLSTSSSVNPKVIAPSDYTICENLPTVSFLEKQIYFDLFDSPSLAFSRERIEEGLHHLEFEDTLQYVALPRLRLEKRKVLSSIRRTVSPDGQGCHDMEFFFNFLRMKGVKRIIRVIVDDSVEPSHSDEAIERALAGLRVELWDWRKIDLSILSIFNAAPDVSEITLYWSGNVVVLRGWEMEMTKSSGLGHLERLNVNVGQVNECLFLLPTSSNSILAYVKIETGVDYTYCLQHS